MITMMILTTVVLVACIHIQITQGFVQSIGAHTPTKLLPLAATVPEYPESFDRAVKCTEHTELCDVSELLELADELEEYQDQVFFENTEHLMDKEVQDRHEVADMLRLQAEWTLRNDYLKKANLFKSDVHQAHDQKQRDHLLDTLGKYDMYFGW